jgi:hypothetical protein
VWIIDPLTILPNPHPKALARPYTLKVLWSKERTLAFYPFIVFTFGLIVESIKELGATLICDVIFKLVLDVVENNMLM